MIELGGFAELLYVREILEAPDRKLVLDKVITGDDVCGNLATENLLASIVPCLIEVNTFDTLHYVDPRWGYTHLKDRGGLIVEVCGSHSGDGCSELCQRPKYGSAIFLIGFDKEIELLRAARLCMNADSMATDYQILDGVLIEDGKYVVVIF